MKNKPNWFSRREVNYSGYNGETCSSYDIKIKEYQSIIQYWIPKGEGKIMWIPSEHLQALEYTNIWKWDQVPGESECYPACMQQLSQQFHESC